MAGGVAVSHLLAAHPMKSYGWPIKFFKDIPELLRVLRDVITGLSP